MCSVFFFRQLSTDPLTVTTVADQTLAKSLYIQFLLNLKIYMKNRRYKKKYIIIGNTLSVRNIIYFFLQNLKYHSKNKNKNKKL
jgi:hypothetical protein